MENIKITPLFIEHLCPHCSKSIIINIRQTMPTVNWILKPDDIKKSKEKAIKGVEEVEFIDTANKEKLLVYLNDENTIVAPEEVEPLVSQVIKDNKQEIPRL